MDIQEQRYRQHQEFLAYRQSELAGPLGSLAVATFAAPLGFGVKEFTVQSPEHVAPVVSLKTVRALGGRTLRQEVTSKTTPPLNSSETYLGYATA